VSRLYNRKIPKSRSIHVQEMYNEANRNAYLRLDAPDKANIDKAIDEINECDVKGLTEDGALELLAALGRFFSETNVRTLRDLYPGKNDKVVSDVY